MLLRKLISNTGSSIIQYIIVLAVISVILLTILILFRSTMHDVGAHAVYSIQADVVVPDN